MARRWQEGSVQLRRGVRRAVWIGRWREDVIDAGGTIRRRCCKQVLGTQRELPTKKLAIRELARRLAPINSPDYRPVLHETFAQFVDYWTANILANKKPSTQASIASQLRTALVPFFGNLMLRDIQHETVQCFVTALRKKPAAPKTIKNYIATLQMIWKQAKANRRVIHDLAFPELDLQRVTNQRRPSFSAEEIRRILGAAVEPCRTFYWLAAESGMRAGELCGLRVVDLELDACLIHITQSAWRNQLQTPKTETSKRTLAISPQLVEHLRRYLLTRRPNPLGLVFATAADKPWAPCVILRHNLHPLLASLGLPRCGLHAFRHSSASLMAHLKTPLKTQQERLGHAPGSKVTLGIYTHAVSEDDRTIANELGQMLCPIASKTASMRNDLAPQGTMIQ